MLDVLHTGTINSQITDNSSLNETQIMLAEMEEIQSLKKTNLINLCLAYFLLFFGAFIFVDYVLTDELDVQISANCFEDNICEVKLPKYDFMNSNYLVYLKFGELYQNYRDYVKSIELKQLYTPNLPEGKLNNCHGFVRNKDINKTKSIYGKQLNPKNPAEPCGMIALTYPRSIFLNLII